MKLNEKLMKLRKEAGLSQEELGNEIHASRQAVSKWESEQTKPDIDKIKEIANFFNVSFDYLLNDDIDEILNKDNQNQKNVKQKVSIKLFLKIILILLLIYLLVVLYKFGVLTRFYLIANSFSEENYSIHQNTNISNNYSSNIHFSESKVKYGKKFITYSYWYEGSTPNFTEDNYIIANQVDYIDADKKIQYRINYDFDTQKYIYYDGDSIFLENNQKGYSDEELKELLNFDKNIVKEITFDYIPSNFKEIILSSLNPVCFVSLRERSITRFHISKDAKIKVTLNNDYVIDSYKFNSEFEGSIYSQFSYDYVPDHQKDFKEPIEIYKDKIESIDEVN